MMWDAICYISCLPLMFVEGMLNSAIYIQNIVQPFLLLFLTKECNQQDNMYLIHHTHKMFHNFSDQRNC